MWPILYIHSVEICLFLLPSHERTAHRTYTTRRQKFRTCREHGVTTLPPMSISRQHRACVTSPSALYCCGYSSCVHRSLRSVIHHLYLCLGCCCVQQIHAHCGRKCKIVWIEYQYHNCINVSDVWCFFTEIRPRNLDIRQHAKDTNNITTPPSGTSSSGPHHERLADPRCTAVASCSIGGCDPSSVITASLFGCAVRCACMRVRCFTRLARGAKNKNIDLW